MIPIEFKEPADADKLAMLDYRLRDIIVPWYRAYASSKGAKFVRCTDLNSVVVWYRRSATHKEFRAIDFGWVEGFALADHVEFARIINNAFRMYSTGPWPVAVVGDAAHRTHIHFQVPRPYTKHGRILLQQ